MGAPTAIERILASDNDLILTRADDDRDVHARDHHVRPMQHDHSVIHRGVHSVLDALDSFGGIYVAMFLFAILSGVFPLANSEAALIALGAASSYSMPKLI